MLQAMPQCDAENCRTSLSKWRDKCIEKKIYARQSFYRALETMRDGKTIIISGEYVQLSQLSHPVTPLSR